MRNARLLIGTLTMLAWFVISNHCMLDAAVSTPATAPVEKQDDCCRMHASKPTAPAQPKEQQGLQICCKNLPATALKPLQPFASLATPFPIVLSDPHDLFEGSRDELPSLCLDTGPPEAFSFSELVLQRSLRAHAPPGLD
jgi:hypothetical protein